MERRRAVLVGAGGMGRTWARNLLDCAEVELVGWVDLRPEVVAEASAALGLRDVHMGADLGEALRTCGADFVVDVSIPEAHHDITLEALAAGLPVLGEKPMADSMERARAMIAAAERAGKLYMVSQSRRYDAGLATLRALIDTHLGPLGILNTDFYLGPHFGGFRETMPSPLLLDMAIHTFDAARYLAGADPVSVYCEEFNPPWSWYAGASCATALFEMSGGLRYTYRGGWSAEGRRTSWDAEWRAVGEGGTATWDGEGAPTCEAVVEREGFFSPVEERRRTVPVWEHSGIAASLREFLGALNTGATPMGECHDNIKSLAMVFAAIESAATGRRVAIRI
ncbi:MAG TPA: Gfo/Idh/MocA family oxidoreductase [Chloroflexota bacterium]|nr:Gfo/Idh/MocA family oxidoreductase [Chloroflexota bacterium]